MDIAWYREKIKHVPKYANSIRWQNRVSKMPPAQVIAIYNNFLKNGYFDRQKNPSEDISENYYQMTIFDFLEEDDLK